MDRREEKESQYGKVLKVAGPLVIAECMEGSAMQELVKVGWDKSVGEIIRLDKDTAAIQCYEDTSGLTIGDPILRTGKPLSVELGPGILENIFDGIQRPLKTIYEKTGSLFVPKGVELPNLSREREWHFEKFTNDAGKPKEVRVGDILYGGDIFGMTRENNLFQKHNIMIPPNIVSCRVLVAPDYGIDCHIHKTVMKVEDNNGRIHDLCLFHSWPVRKPRPVAEKLQGIEPLLTGQRVLDCLYPSVLGGTCCIPGAFGCGKTCISQALSKYSNSHGIIYVGCGERGNEMAEVLADFPELTIKVNNKDEGIMQRTCLIANTSNMPVAAREASIYTGITLAEYFRDMGYNMNMMADSTSRWAEAFREIYGRLAEMPAEQGYPAYMKSRLAEFYERAGNVRCLGSPERFGAVTIVGAVSPPGGDFSEPVTTDTLSIVQVFWGLDKSLAQRKHFPSVDWNKSYSNYAKILEEYFDETYNGFVSWRDTIASILQEEGSLNEIVRLVGRDSLTEDQKVTIEVAKVIKEEFLQQNAYTDYDYTCPLWKTAGMAKCLVHFYNLCNKVLAEQDKEKDHKVGWDLIRHTMSDEFNELKQLKFKEPSEDNKVKGEKEFTALCERMNKKFKNLEN